jgi:RHS repeat-associated protein
MRTNPAGTLGRFFQRTLLGGVLTRVLTLYMSIYLADTNQQCLLAYTRQPMQALVVPRDFTRQAEATANLTRTLATDGVRQYPQLLAAAIPGLSPANVASGLTLANGLNEPVPSPCSGDPANFILTARAKPGKVQLGWTPLPNAQMYQVYRTSQADPFLFTKVGETLSTYATFLDTVPANEVTYLYIVGAAGPGRITYSEVASAHPTTARVLRNYSPIIYSCAPLFAIPGVLYTYQVRATDPNDDKLAFDLVTAPTDMTIDTTTGLIRWTPQAGVYDVVVMVTDGRGGSDSQSFQLSVPIPNSPPTADAGPDQTASVTQTVLLDGSKSSDADGNSLTFTWSFASRPAGSAAALSDPSALNPNFVIDLPGTYVLQLVVNDGTVDSAPDTVSITTLNSPPVANAGPDQSTSVAQTVTLDGSKSSDVDGNPLTFVWAFVSQPAGSAAALSDPTAVKPTFVADVFGTYVVQLVVNDGLVNSSPDTVSITTLNSPPVANAGPDQTATVGQTVTLDGSKSSDVDGNVLTYAWSFVTVPAGSAAVLSDATAVKPTFGVDLPGNYVLQLIVNDGFGNSAPDTVSITTLNSPPVAYAGPDQSTSVSQTVTLDGSKSSDVDGNPLTYRWALLSKPVSSAATLSDLTAVAPSFVADLAGTYLVQLIVNDGTVDSGPDSVSITATQKLVTVPNVVGLTQAAAEAAIVAAQLKVGTETTVNSSTVPAGQVISQAPSAGASAPAGSAVNLVMSLGPTMVIVPNVVGLTQAAAEAALLAVKLAVGAVTTANHPTVPAGQVISQTPVAGNSVPESSAVALVVSLGSGAPVLVSIKVTPANVTVAGGVSQQYTATGTWSDGTTQNLTATATWSVVNPALALVSSVGLATALDPGSTTIQASRDGVTGGAGLTVVAPALASIVITPATPTILVGQNQAFAATGVLTDGTSQNLAGQVTWGSTATAVAAINAAGTATGASDGTTTISANKGGIIGTTVLTVKATVTESISPTAAITSPANNSTLTSPADVIGTANDANFLKYILEIAPAGETAFTKIAEGTTPVVNGTLGKFDPTLLLNDLYTVRLTVFDRGGNTTQAIVSYQVARDQKVGIFSLTFQDLNIPVAGLPITVNRVYDSRDKGKGDFGVGWRLDIQTMKVRANRVQGTAWQVNKSGGFFPTYTLAPSDDHKVSVTLPDGKVEEFDLTPTPSSSVLLPLDTVTAVYTPRAGTLGKLTPLDGTEIWIIDGQPGPVTLYYFADIEIYDPQVFQYTGEDGTVFTISKTAGVQSVRDPNGNTLTIGPNGVTHSSGKGIAFLRDGQGRVTQITDPNGNIQRYSYDANGDLVSHTDALNNVTRILYSLQHGLIEVRDPTGARPIRNEYDSEGRLIAHIDSLGNRVEYTHNTGARQEIIEDREGGITVLNYDAAGNVINKTDPLGGVTLYTYDSRGNKLTETNPLGHTTTLTYDAKNHVLTKTDALGNKNTYTYDSLGHVLTATDPRGNVSINIYDSKGNLLSRKDRAGNTTTQTYTATGNIGTVTDAAGGVTRYEYDAADNLAREIDPLGNATTYTYDANGNRLTRSSVRTTPTGPVTMVTTYQYDARNRAIAMIDANGNTTRTEYTRTGKKSAIINPLGAATRFEYDSRGNTLRTLFPDGTQETNTYDREGRRISTADRSGHTTTYQYDLLGRLVRTAYADGAAAQTEYDAASRVVKTTNERGFATTHTYDSAGRVISDIDALGRITFFQYDQNGNQTQITDARGNILRHEYDANNRRIKTIYPNGTSTLTTYDALGKTTSSTDQEGQTTSFAYDAGGALIRVTDALGNTTTFGYDEAGNRIRQTDANGHITSFEYDDLGQQIRRVLPVGQSETKIYDPLGNVISKTDFNGKTITYTYSPCCNRLVSQNLPNGEQVLFAYTGTGKRTAVTDSRGTTLYTYDLRDRLTQRSEPNGAIIQYTYDAAGNRTSLVGPAGATLYSYDALNRLTTVTDTTGGVSQYNYDEVGNRSHLAYPNGTFTEYTYDSLNRLTQLLNRDSANAVISSYSYTLGPIGNRTKVVENTGRTVDYSYDPTHKLTGETITEPSSTRTIAYVYDPVGNRLSRTDNGVVTIYSYDANDRLLSETGTTYTYDDNGNTLTRTTGAALTAYAYDFQNRLVQAALTSPGKNTTTQYTYDADGLRVQSVVNGSDETNYLVDGSQRNPEVIEERASDGTLLASYCRGDDLISQHRNGVASYYLYDGNMSTRQLSNLSQAVTDTYDYDAFGNLLRRTGATLNNFLYNAQQFDPNIGFYYLRARYYDPSNGRFLTSDDFRGSLFDPISLHKYLYGRCDPVNSTDPTGQFSFVTVIIVIIILAILLGIGAFLASRDSCPLGEAAAQVTAIGPLDALTAQSLAREAMIEAQISGLPGIHNGQADAFRHCFWSCRMAQEIGASQAQAVGDTHERCSKGPPAEEAMDLANNATGRSYGTPGADCHAQCFTGATSGTLQTAP